MDHIEKCFSVNSANTRRFRNIPFPQGYKFIFGNKLSPAFVFRTLEVLPPSLLQFSGQAFRPICRAAGNTEREPICV